MSAPAERPAATPRLTEESLAAIERAYAEYADPFNPYIRADDVVDYLPTLLAEVRRQRAVLADLARYDAEIFRLVGHEAELPQEQPEEPRRFGLFDLLEPRTGPPAPREPDRMTGFCVWCHHPVSPPGEHAASCEGQARMQLAALATGGPRAAREEL